MIIDGVITYGNIGGDILTWRFSSDVVNELAIAVLLTILSYQVAETVINLFFGWKQQGQATFSDIQIMLLIRQFSPMSVLRTMASWRSRKGRREETNEDDEEFVETTREERAISLRAYVKLVALLVAIPLINVGTVVLSFERNTTLTFAEGNFGGLAFGLDKDKSISDWSPLSRSPKSICNGTALQTSAAEFAIAQFFSCTLDISDLANPPQRNDTFRVTVKTSSAERVSVAVVVATHRIELVKRTMILSRNVTSSIREKNVTVSKQNITLPQGENPASEETKFLFHVKSNLSKEDANFLLRRGMELAEEHCDLEGEVQEGKDEDGSGTTLGRFVGCRRDPQRSENADRESAFAVVNELTSLLSFVNSDTIEVRNDFNGNRDEFMNENFFSGDNLLLLKRQRGFASIPILAMAAFASMLLRMLSELITKNDLERGIGLIVRDGLGLPCCDSMLCSPDVVARYDRRGNVLHSIEQQPRGSRRDTESANRS